MVVLYFYFAPNFKLKFCYNTFMQECSRCSESFEDEDMVWIDPDTDEQIEYGQAYCKGCA